MAKKRKSMTDQVRDELKKGGVLPAGGGAAGGARGGGKTAREKAIEKEAKAQAKADAKAEAARKRRARPKRTGLGKGNA